jgi:hypothetical protein
VGSSEKGGQVMKQSTFTRDGYVITSYGNGAAYAIKCLNSGDELFVQGDDALQIESDTQDFKCLDVLSDYFF